MKLRPLLVLIALAGLHSTVRAQDADPTKPDEVFGLTRVWSMHLTVQPKDWEKMHPARGGFNRARKDAPALSEERKPRGGFGYDFEYVSADLDIDGQKFKNVAVRFKGNSTYLLTANHLKRPFKIDLDRYDEDQTWKGLKKLTLNNNVMDPTATRESLAFAVYRAAGVPAPRTAFAELTLTVPGKYERTLVGLYTLVETVDKTFLKRDFKSHKGLLCKPERAGALNYLGENWSSYEAAYRPKTKASKSEQRRLIEFTHLVQRGTDDDFRSRIGAYLDVERFLRYVAATVVLSSMDSFVGLGHNYYLYLDPKTNQFTIFPWDVDHSFGALTMVGSKHDLFNLSLRNPTQGNNRLIERLLREEKHLKTYKGHVERLVKSTFTNDWVKTNAAVIAKTIAPSRAREKQAISKRGENWNTWKVLEVFNPPPSVEEFTKNRLVSIENQLAGKSEGKVLRSRGANPTSAEGQLARRIVQAMDRDGDRMLSQDEASQGIRDLIQFCGGKGQLDGKQLRAGLEKLIPRPRGFFFARQSAAVPLARGIAARVEKDGKMTEDDVLRAAEELFARHDSAKKGRLDERQLAQALRTLLAPPRPAVAENAKSKK